MKLKKVGKESDDIGRGMASKGGKRKGGSMRARMRERRVMICLATYKNPYANAIVSPAYISIDLKYPAK